MHVSCDCSGIVCVVICLPSGSAAASRGFADSKKLTEAKREELFAALLLQQKLGWATDSLTAAFISEQMLQAYAPSSDADLHTSLLLGLQHNPMPHVLAGRRSA